MAKTPHAALLLVPVLVFTAAGRAQDRQQRFPLETTAGLRPHNVTVEAATLDGKKGVKMALSEAGRQKLEALKDGALEQLAVIEGTAFDNGVIEAEIAGAPRPGAPEGARGFVGIAFRVQDDMRTYDAFYLRPTNGRAEDQVRRNHSAQYISHPDFPWFRLRKETPEKYESYVDLVPGAWTKVKIEVKGTQGRLYVHDQPQPTLVVNDLKTGAAGRGAVALWLDTSTVAHYRNVTVTREPAPAKP
jgi:hypothetical protein